MTEYPVLFDGEMVRAILAGLKTQTRRPIKLRDFGPSTTAGYDWDYRDKHGCWNSVSTERLMERCPFGVPGDTLWVRESWRMWSWGEDADLGIETRDGKRHWIDKRTWEDEDRMYDWEDRMWTQSADDCEKGGMVYDENAESYAWPDGREWDPPTRWRPSIHMPRWASRLSLLPMRRWVEQVQDIGDDNALAEGVDRTNTSIPGYATARFRHSWDAIYAKRGLGSDTNPWLFGCEWEAVKA